MKNSTKSFAGLIFLWFFTSTAAFTQPATGYSEMFVLLKADTTTKSVLVSNLFADRAGDQSPVMGAAAWFDQGKHLQCRSLIAFDYGMLPLIIKPDQITSAQLILNPVELEKAVVGDKEGQNSKIIIRRVLQPWEDSLTTWMNQPMSNSSEEVIKNVPAKKKDRSVKIDVTKMVKDMFVLGNNGFMICNQDSLQKVSTYSQWFASAKNENQNIRPVLVIHYAVPYYSSQNKNQKIPDLPMTAKDRDDLMKIYFRPEPIIVTPPVKD